MRLSTAVVFVSEVQMHSSLRCVLTPAPGFAGHYFLLMVSGRARVLRGVPSREDNVLYPRNSFRHGDVLDEGVRGLQPPPDSEDEDQADTGPTQTWPAVSSQDSQAEHRVMPTLPEDDEPDEAVAMIQLQSRCSTHEAAAGGNSLDQGPAAAGETLLKDRADAAPGPPRAPVFTVPTPFGRRRVNVPQPAPVTLSLDACLPTTASGAKEKSPAISAAQGCGRTGLCEFRIGVHGCRCAAAPTSPCSCCGPQGRIAC